MSQGFKDEKKRLINIVNNGEEYKSLKIDNELRELL